MVAAQTLVFAAWRVGAVALVGIGLLTRRSLGDDTRGADDLFHDFWLGWATLVLALQVWHLALPVDVRATATAMAFGLAGVAWRGRRPLGRLLRRLFANLPAVLLATGAAVWMTNHALHGARYGDANAYFIPTVWWYVTHPIVPGLGNFHARYALNQ